jgi:microcin C transport system substrate-binding protein
MAIGCVALCAAVAAGAAAGARANGVTLAQAVPAATPAASGGATAAAGTAGADHAPRAADATGAAGTTGAAVPRVFRHAVAQFGNARYPPDFAHFDWVNADAPKGGRIVLAASDGFDSFNPLAAKGRPVAGIAGVGYENWLYDRLLEAPADEPDVRYGRLASGVWMAADFRTVAFRLRPEARWHDGVPITADDVVFAFDTIKARGTPALKVLLRDIERAEAVSAHEVVFHVGGQAPASPAVAVTLGELYPLPRHYWRDRDAAAPYDTPPLGSGPYRVAGWRLSRFVEYERVLGYWGRDLAVNRGRHNFDHIRYEYYRDAYALRQTLKQGGIDAEAEGSSQAWTYEYEIDAVRDGMLRKRMLPVRTPVGVGLNALMMNTRKPPLDDVRVREAIALAPDFEWNQRVVLQNVYVRTRSYFTDSILEQRVLPSAAERALLEPFRGRVPERVFTEVYEPPVTSGHGIDRAPLLRAARLLDAAGWPVVDGRRVHRDSGAPLAVEFMLVTPAHVRIVAPYLKRLERIGFTTKMRTVDSSQFTQRMARFDFDIAVRAFTMPVTPGLELRGRLGSATANVPHGANWLGIADPVVDALIDRIVESGSLDDYLTAGHALDRVLQWNFYAVPGFKTEGTRFVWWDRFGMPARHGEYRTGFPDAWWFDAERSARVDRWQAAAGHRRRQPRPVQRRRRVRPWPRCDGSGTRATPASPLRRDGGADPGNCNGGRAGRTAR